MRVEPVDLNPTWQQQIVRLFPWLVDWDEPTEICPSLQGLDPETALTILLDKGEVKPANWLRHYLGHRVPALSIVGRIPTDEDRLIMDVLAWYNRRILVVLDAGSAQLSEQIGRTVNLTATLADPESLLRQYRAFKQREAGS